ncbi:MAG: hypothetical protein GY701_08010 [Sulfitobacter sp.]|nr:hypothetical protein [Sulfitobacter sp.]
MRSFDVFDLSDLRLWRDGFEGPAPGVLETVANWVGFSQLMVVLRLCWPTFIEVKGCVLLPWEYDEKSFDGWWAQHSGHREMIEGTINHLHLWDVFDPDEVPAEGLHCLGETLAHSWSAALSEQFPGRVFGVHFSDGEDDYGPTVRITS